MEELSIEEKAKRYDEAIEKLRQFYRDYDTVSCLIDVKEELANLFPELTESEDEEVRKVLYEYFKNRKNDGDIDETWYGISYDKILAWLEKQGQTFTKKDVDDAYLNGVCDTKHELERQGEQKIIIPKFRIGDEIKTSNEESLIITKIDEKGYWSEDLFICDFDEECLWDLVKQKPAWSEEDDYIIEILFCLLDNEQDNYPRLSSYFKDIEKTKIWLKALKERYTWKPSDLPRWKKSTLPNDNTTGFNSDYFHYKGYNINYKELFEKLPKDE